MWNSGQHKSIVIDGERRINASIAQSRLSILGVCFVAAYLVMALRLLDLGIVRTYIFPEKENQLVSEQKDIAHEIAARRGDVYDRNGFLIATTIKSPRLYVKPSMVLDSEELTAKLATILPNMNQDKARKLMRTNKDFAWLAYDITPAQQQQVLEVGDPALGFRSHYKRVYPQEALFAHMLGHTSRDGLGLSGIERSFNETLAGGDDVTLSLDLRLQHAVKREVQRAIDEFSAKAGVGIILDAHSGEVLAGVSLPDFDLNHAGKAKPCEEFNRMTLGVYELGSMFKIFSTAALLELKKVGMDQSFDARYPIKIGRHRIDDYHAQKRILNVPEVFMYSSNIGAALMGQMVGGESLKAFYKDLGLMDALDFDIKEIGRPITPKPWRESSTMTVSYGHGLSTSPLQMTAAVASIVNGGLSVRSTLLVEAEDDYPIKSDVRLISEKTSMDMRRLLRLVVTQGTAKKADVSGIAIGGKTGTAEKIINGRYSSDKLISSFVGAFPIDDPRYIIMVMVDEPHGTKESYGYATAGWVAAPVAKHIVQSIVSILGLSTDQYDPNQDISLDILPYIHDKKHKGKQLASSYR
ncbi:MAG: penicillin-binding protein 2 [Alphaproteobacteria bacterium]|nr:penicillin-binding protein 2 [Alphaproteobacteria bacterium]